jgi:hypothetical protein
MTHRLALRSPCGPRRLDSCAMAPLAEAELLHDRPEHLLSVDEMLAWATEPDLPRPSEDFFDFSEGPPVNPGARGVSDAEAA